MNILLHNSQRLNIKSASLVKNACLKPKTRFGKSLYAFVVRSISYNDTWIGFSGYWNGSDNFLFPYKRIERRNLPKKLKRNYKLFWTKTKEFQVYPKTNKIGWLIRNLALNLDPSSKKITNLDKLNLNPLHRKLFFEAVEEAGWIGRRFRYDPKKTHSILLGVKHQIDPQNPYYWVILKAYHEGDYDDKRIVTKFVLTPFIREFLFAYTDAMKITYKRRYDSILIENNFPGMAFMELQLLAKESNQIYRWFPRPRL